MKTLNKPTLSAKKLLATLLLGAAALSATPASAAPVVACGSISLQATEPDPAGPISCVAYGDGNIQSDGTLSPGDQTVTGTLPSPFPSTLITDVNLNGQGVFTIASSVWNTWDTIYLGIKQGEGGTPSGGGWALFLVGKVVDQGNYLTKLQASQPNSDHLGFSHYFAVGGLQGGGGPIPQVPVPAAVWLFGSGMLGLLGLKRRTTKLAA